MRESEIPEGYICVSNIPNAIIKPYGKKGLMSCVVYACGESESGYASVVFNNSAFVDVQGNDNVKDLLILRNSNLYRSVKRDGKYTSDKIRASDFAYEFEMTHSEYYKKELVKKGRRLTERDDTGADYRANETATLDNSLPF